MTGSEGQRGEAEPGSPCDASEAVSTLRHELRTPTLAMREALALLLEEVAGPLTEEQKRFVTLAQQNLQRLNGLIDELLDLLKPGAKAKPRRLAP